MPVYVSLLFHPYRTIFSFTKKFQNIFQRPFKLIQTNPIIWILKTSIFLNIFTEIWITTPTHIFNIWQCFYPFWLHTTICNVSCFKSTLWICNVTEINLGFQIKCPWQANCDFVKTWIFIALIFINLLGIGNI